MSSQVTLDDLWGSSEEEVPIKSSFNSNVLAKYFQQKLLSSSWYTGFGIVNQRALAGQFAKWKKNNTEYATVVAMIDLYMSDYTMRGNVPGWQDFVYKRDKLASSISNTGEKSQSLDKWDALDAEYDEEAEMQAYLARRSK
jgi:hypothetical protein